MFCQAMHSLIYSSKMYIVTRQCKCQRMKVNNRQDSDASSSAITGRCYSRPRPNEYLHVDFDELSPLIRRSRVRDTVDNASDVTVILPEVDVASAIDDDVTTPRRTNVFLYARLGIPHRC